MSEDDVFEYVLKEVASCEHNDRVSPWNTTYKNRYGCVWPLCDHTVVYPEEVSIFEIFFLS